MKSQEDRIRDAAEELDKFLPLDGASKMSRLEAAAAMLEAADREKPKWPTDESVERFYRALGWDHQSEYGHIERWRDGLRAAFLADPIIKTAISLRDRSTPGGAPVGGSVKQVLDAVNDAGL